MSAKNDKTDKPDAVEASEDKSEKTAEDKVTEDKVAEAIAIRIHAGKPGMDNMDEAEVLGRLEQVAASTHRKHPFAPTTPATIDMDLGLQCLRLMVKHKVIAPDELTRMANRVNVLLRAHPPLQLNLEVSE